MNNSIFGQRGFTIVLTGVITLVLFLIGAGNGTPGSLPVDESGNILSAEGILQALAPLGIILGSLFFTLRSVTNRVNSGEFNPNDVSALFKTREFWMNIAVTITGALQAFGLQFWTAEQSSIVVDLFVNFVMVAIGVIGASSYASRPNGMRAAVNAQTKAPVFFKDFVDEQEKVA
jgi:hypothetical protein